jgi:hypothetical protein
MIDRLAVLILHFRRRPPHKEHPHITMLVCFFAAMLTVVLVTVVLAHFATP